MTQCNNSSSSTDLVIIGDRVFNCSSSNTADPSLISDDELSW